MSNITQTQKRISFVLKCIVFFSAVIGTVLSYLAGRDSFMGGSHVFTFFTIQSNIAIAIICAIGAYLMYNEKEISKVWYIIKFVGTVSITLTGVVFGFTNELPFMGSAWWILLLLIFLIAVGYGYLAIAEFISKKWRKKHAIYFNKNKCNSIKGKRNSA